MRAKGLSFDEVPRTEDGIVVGVWRALHSSPAYTGEFGVAQFRDGRSERPLAGRMLVRLAGAMGFDVTFEPWTGPLPPDWVAPEATPLVIPESILARFTARHASPSGEVDSVHSDHKPPPPDARTESVSTDDEAPKRRGRPPRVQAP